MHFGFISSIICNLKTVKRYPHPRYDLVMLLFDILTCLFCNIAPIAVMILPVIGFTKYWIYFENQKNFSSLGTVNKWSLKHFQKFNHFVVHWSQLTNFHLNLSKQMIRHLKLSNFSETKYRISFKLFYEILLNF